jgi:hypothetical protein
MLYRVLLFPLQILHSPELDAQDELFVDLAATTRTSPKKASAARESGRLCERSRWTSGSSPFSNAKALEEAITPSFGNDWQAIEMA